MFKEKKNEKDENLKETIRTILEQYGLEQQTFMDIFDFYCKKYNDIIIINENELQKEKENKKIYKKNELLSSNENEEIKSGKGKEMEIEEGPIKIEEDKIGDKKDKMEIETEVIKSKENKLIKNEENNGKENKKEQKNSINNDCPLLLSSRQGTD